MPLLGLHKRTDANGRAEEAASGDSDTHRRRSPEEACGRHRGYGHNVHDTSAAASLSGQVESASLVGQQKSVYITFSFCGDFKHIMLRLTLIVLCFGWYSTYKISCPKGLVMDLNNNYC